MSTSTVFSTADLFTGFHQIPCDEDTQQKVAITTDFGQFTWTAMPMGGKNAPAVFQQMMDKIFKDIPSSELAIYLDDLCLHSTTYEQNLEIIRKVLHVLRRNNLKIRAAKTEFLKNKIKFCGALLENGYRRPNPEKTKAVAELRHPQNAKEAQSIFGLLNYHRNFIAHFATKTAPITLAYKKGFRWTTEAANALEAMKAEIVERADKLKIPTPDSGHYAIETDASDAGLGAVLLYKTAKEKRYEPAAYLSHKFDEAQKNYNTYEKELLAGKKAMEKWSHYLLGRRFEWITDNSCVNWAHKIKARKLKIAKWLAEISDFDFVTILKPSSQMAVSDCLSRQLAENNVASIKMISGREMADIQQSEQELVDVERFSRINRWPNDRSRPLQGYYKIREKIGKGPDGEIGVQLETFKPFPPQFLVNDILQEYHDKSGHPGISQTFDGINRKYFIPNLRDIVTEYIKSCDRCQRVKPMTNPLNSPLGHVLPPSKPFERFAIDLIGPLPITTRNYKHICVSTDLFSKKTYAQPLRNKNPSEILRVTMAEWLRNPFADICPHG